ncbi:Gelsolin-like domain [Dillenia turbinata]|uniref:Gelsolin-like domain n=1 Tax=Dillenia turbinata TaxID=194707 RepID=A0AAN8UU95_9MAGN
MEFFLTNEYLALYMFVLLFLSICFSYLANDQYLDIDLDCGLMWSHSLKSLNRLFAPLPRKTSSHQDKSVDTSLAKLSRVTKGQAEPLEGDTLTRVLLDTNTCGLLDCGLEVFVWMGRNTSLDERKSASSAAEEERELAISLASKMVESLKFLPSQVDVMVTHFILFLMCL